MQGGSFSLYINSDESWLFLHKYYFRRRSFSLFIYLVLLFIDFIFLFAKMRAVFKQFRNKNNLNHKLG